MRKQWWVVGAALLVMAAPAVAQTAKGYEFAKLDADFRGAWGTSCVGINSRGEVVGNYMTADNAMRGFIWRKGRFIDIPGVSPYDAGSDLMAISDNGVSVGQALMPGGYPYAGMVRDARGNLALLTSLERDAAWMQPTGINNSGAIVGQIVDWARMVWTAFIYRDGVLTNVDAPGGGVFGWPGAFETCVYGINDHGQMAVRWWDANEDFTVLTSGAGVLGTDGAYTPIELDIPGAAGIDNLGGINNRGQVVGSYRDTDGVGHGFVWQNGTATRVDVPFKDASDTIVLGINDNGTIVGTYGGWNYGFIAWPKP